MRKISKTVLAAMAGVSLLALAMPQTIHAKTFSDMSASEILNPSLSGRRPHHAHRIHRSHHRAAREDDVPEAASFHRHHHHKHHHNRHQVPKHDTNYMGLFAHIRSHERYRSIGGNTRDLGNYVVSHGRYKIKPGRIIRSADLDSISRRGVHKLKKLHVRYVDDLRDDGGRSGIEAKPDPSELNAGTMHHTGIHYVINPIYTTRQHQDHIHNVLAYYGDPAVTSHRAIRSYKTTFKLLLHNHHGAVLYHCSLGRDRTGTTTALILSALGANRSTIFHDYLLTDHYCYRYGKIHHKPYRQQAAELQKFFNTIDHHYGSVHSYLRHGLGLSGHQINRLKSNYLVRE